MKLNLGCGRERLFGYENHDQEINLEKKLPWQDDCIEKIRLHQVLEHITNDLGLIEECWRILKPNGELEITCPHTSDIHSAGTLTHKRSGYNYYSFEPLQANSAREYYTKARFTIKKRRILTHQAYQWLADWKPKKYEEWISRYLPARNIEIVLVKIG